MPRTLPATLESAMDNGSFNAYFAIGKRNYTGSPPSSMTGYTTLIQNDAILYYKYDGLNLEVHWHSENMPADDGLILGNKYYLERGVIIEGVTSTIKTASLRFDDYTIHRQIVTGYFSLFSADEKTASMDGYNTYTNILTAYNPTDYYLGTVQFRETVENAGHWSYNFYPSGRSLALASNQKFLSLIRQKYLIEAVDNSDDLTDDGIMYYHLSSPIAQRYWFDTADGPNKAWDVCWSDELGIFVGVSAWLGTGFCSTSSNGLTWTSQTMPSTPTGFGWASVCWSPELSLFVAVSNTISTGNVVATSPDGVTWTARTANRNGWNSVCWSASLGLFVAVGTNNNKVMYSSNGTSWTEVSTSLPGAWLSVCWSPELSLFVACGSNGVNPYMTSTNGTTWTLSAGTALGVQSITWSPELSLFVAVGAVIATSSNGTAWTTRETPSTTLSKSAWSASLGIFAAVGGNADIYISSDGITWTTETAETDTYWRSIAFSTSLNRFCAVGWLGSGSFCMTSAEAMTPDHTITRQDIKLKTDALSRSFVWRDEASTIHTSGSGITHNLGYLESTASAPASFENSDRAELETGIHLKYKSGDIFTLKIDETKTATYHGKVTEILDPKNAIGWRVQIRLIERFSNTDAGPLPSSIEQVAAYTPLVTNNFDGNLDATVNNLQALAERVDELPLGSGPTTSNANDFQVGDGAGNWITKTLAQTITILRTSLDSVYQTVGSYITDAASDSIYYVRRNATWTNAKTYFDTLYSTLGHTHAASDIASGTIATARLGSGSASSSTYLRGDQTWATVSASANDWQEISDSWSYASASTITVPTDATTTYNKGVKIRLKQGGGYKYFVGKTIAATLITVIVNTDYTVANSAISDIAISYLDSPNGWPEWFSFTPTWSGTGTSLGNGSIVGKYRMHGRNGIFVKERLTGGSTTNWGSGFFNFSLPVDASYIINLSSLESAAGNILDSSASTRYALAAFVRTSDMRGIYGNTILLQGSPITFATSDEINLSAFYEW